MTRVRRLLVGFVMLAGVLSAAGRDAAGQTGELEVTLRVLDDATGVAAPRITIPPEASRRETPEPPATPPSPPAEEPPADSSDAPASAAQ